MGWIRKRKSTTDTNFTSVLNRVEVFRGKTNQMWYWRAIANNGRSIAIGGEGYVNHDDAKKMAEALFPGVKITDG